MTSRREPERVRPPVNRPIVSAARAREFVRETTWGSERNTCFSRPPCLLSQTEEFRLTAGSRENRRKDAGIVGGTQDAEGVALGVSRELDWCKSLSESLLAPR